MTAFSKTCHSSNFYDRLKKHSSYPDFGSTTSWKQICDEYVKIPMTNSPGKLKKFLTDNFFIKQFSRKRGVLTGYYEPFINLSLVKDQNFKFPILKKTERFINKSREYIEKNYINEEVLFWTDSKIELFFLQIQGSGIGILPNKKEVKLAFDGSNNLKYTSIGKFMIKKKIIPSKQVSMHSIKNWLYKNPNMTESILNQNKRYIFFPLNYGWAFITNSTLAKKVKLGYTKENANTYKNYSKTEIKSFINWLIKVSKENPQYTFVIRPHPSISIYQYKNLFIHLNQYKR